VLCRDRIIAKCWPGGKFAAELPGLFREVGYRVGEVIRIIANPQLPQIRVHPAPRWYTWPVFRRKARLLGLTLLLLLAWAALAQAQSAAPTPQPPPTPAPTEPPAILVVQPTPVPTPALQGNLWRQLQQVFDQNRGAVLLAFIMGVVGVIVGVFIQRGAEKIHERLGWILRRLFDPLAAAPIVRLLYENQYRKKLAESVQNLPGGKLVGRELKLDDMYVPALLTRETRVKGVENLANSYRTRREIRRL
jgi:hypothetical protein